ncbi:MAG: hypothetical protein J6T35_00265 [Bacteroidales bacterium]|nr:hypothetical protein [Bacteroidales bacterium]
MPLNAPIDNYAIMVDKAIAEIQTGLADTFDWLDAVFGRAQRITRVINGKRVVVPACYCGGWNGHGENDYIEVGPDSKIGNFVFFEVDDPETIDAGAWGRTITAPFSLIFWGNMDVLNNEKGLRNGYFAKAYFLKFLEGRYGWHLEHGSIVTTRMWEKAENIYKGYTLDEVDAQYLMQPYYGVRIDGILKVDEVCLDL